MKYDWKGLVIAVGVSLAACAIGYGDASAQAAVKKDQAAEPAAEPAADQAAEPAPAQPAQGKGAAPTVSIVSMEVIQGEGAEVCVLAEDQGDGVERIELHIDGVSVTSSRRGLGDECPEDAEVFDVFLIPGPNQIEAVAYSSGGIASEPARAELIGESPLAHATLHILAVGIDDYANASDRLNFATADARAFADSIAAGAAGLFGNVNVQLLLNEQASSSGIMRAFHQLAKPVGEDDVFVFFYAGHGIVGEFGGSSNFYLVPSNIQDMSDGGELAMSAVSAEDLRKYLSWIRAGTKLVVLDACQSGEVVLAFHEKTGIARDVLGAVSSSTSTLVFAAAGPTEPARELEAISHGLFTFALLQGMSGDGEHRQVLTIDQIVSRTQEQFNPRQNPELYAKYRVPRQTPYRSVVGADVELIIR